LQDRSVTSLRQGLAYDLNKSTLSLINSPCISSSYNTIHQAEGETPYKHNLQENREKTAERSKNFGEKSSGLKKKFNEVANLHF